MHFFIVLSLLFLATHSPLRAQDYVYECRKKENRVIHIVALQPQKYVIAFIKAHNQVFGRETIESIARRTGADIAVNAGFFEIGNSQDGMPSGTLIINNQVVGLTLQKHACLVAENEKKIKIQDITPYLKIKIGKNALTPKKVNKFAAKEDIVFYSRLWGAQTLTPLKGRQEIAINAQNKVVAFSHQGNTAIPQDGFVLSLPLNYPLEPVAPGDEAAILLEPFDVSKDQKTSAVMGIPILIQEGKINPALKKNQGLFYKSPHARTALGTRANGDLVIVVVEHIYKKPLQEVTLAEIKSLIMNNKEKIAKHYKKTSLNHLTVSEIKEIAEKEFAAPDGAIGLTLPELAALMKDLGCESAINLDGGGSSSLFLNNRVVNHMVGDKDENRGGAIMRPISDAIVFRRIAG